MKIFKFNSTITILLLIGILMIFSGCNNKATSTLQNNNSDKSKQSVSEVKPPDDHDVSMIVYELDAKTVTNEQQSTVRNIIRARLDSKGLFDASVYFDKDNKVIVELPKEKKPESIAEDLIKSAKIEFKDYSGKVLLDGNDIGDAKAEFAPADVNGWFVSLELTEGGKKKFSDATERIAFLAPPQNHISIFLDDRLISDPSVTQKIDGDSVIIEGSFSAHDAQEMASVLKPFSVPMKLVSAKYYE